MYILLFSVGHCNVVLYILVPCMRQASIALRKQKGAACQYPPLWCPQERASVVATTWHLILSCVVPRSWCVGRKWIYLEHSLDKVQSQIEHVGPGYWFTCEGKYINGQIATWKLCRWDLFNQQHENQMGNGYCTHAFTWQGAKGNWACRHADHSPYPVWPA